jgi:hypothetical protein
MPKAIQISRQSTVWIPHLQSYKLVVEALNPQNMPQEVFIKQRLRNFAQDSFDDNFVAVCTPVQLEDLPINSPDAGGSFYRVSKIELVGRLPEAIDKIFDSLIYEVQKLVDDLNALDYLKSAQIYDITAGSTELIPGPTPSPITSNKIRIGGSGYLESFVVDEWQPAAVTVYVNNFDALPGAGNVNLLYIASDTNTIYRWDTSTNSYIVISAGSIAQVSSVAGRTGDVVLTKDDVAGITNAAVSWTVNHTLVDGTRYLAGDLVYFQGNIYRAKFDNESLPVSDETYWENIGPGYRLNIDGRDIPNIPPTATWQTLSGKPATFTPSTHGHDIAAITGLQTALNGKQASGNYATLEGGKVPSTQLPSYVDDVVEYNDLSSFPATGEQGKIYINTANNKTYRWSGSVYLEINPSEVESVNSQTGSVVLNAADVGAAPQEHTHNFVDLNLLTAVDPARSTDTLYIGNATTTGANFSAANRTLILVPIVVPKRLNITRFAFKVGSTGWAVNGSVYLGLYTVGPQGLPNDLLVQQQVTASTDWLAGSVQQTAVLENTIPINPGIQWLAFLNMAGGTVQLAGALPSNAWLMNLALGSNPLLTGTAPEALNTFVSTNIGDVMPDSLQNLNFQHTVNSASSTALRFRVSAPMLLFNYIL